jgi:nucleoid-associated protein YgaU
MADKDARQPDFDDVTGDSSTTGPAPGDRTHTVRPGDTLSRLARQYYQDAGDWRRIYEANRDRIRNPDLIYPGQVLIIPDGTRPTGASI